MPVGVYKRIITDKIREANRKRSLGRHKDIKIKEKIKKRLWGKNAITGRAGL